MSIRPYIGRPARRQHGAYAAAFAIFVIVLLGFTGLAIDAGRLYISKGELQNAADACALSAAAALTGANNNQLEQAEAFGITAGRRNFVGMQETEASIPADGAVTFSATLGGNYQTKSLVANPTGMHFARCTLTESNIRTFLIHVINLLPGNSIGLQEVSATAVASNSPSRSNCALPLAVCKRSPAPPGADANGYRPGEWIEGLWDPGQGLKGGYKWIEFPGYERTPDLEALIRGTGQCDLNNTNRVNSHPGQINALVDAWNSRFGVWKGSGLNGVPDLTGYAYTDWGGSPSWPAGADAFEDFKSRRASFQAWNNQPALGGGWQGSTGGSNGVHAAGGDRRMVVGPVIDCALLAQNGQNIPIQDWACYLMLHPVSNPNGEWKLEYRGSASDMLAGCVTSGLPGGPSAGGPKVPTLVQ